MFDNKCHLHSEEISTEGWCIKVTESAKYIKYNVHHYELLESVVGCKKNPRGNYLESGIERKKERKKQKQKIENK